MERFKYSVFSLIGDKMDMIKTSGLVIDDNGRIYVSDLKKDRVMRFVLEPE